MAFSEAEYAEFIEGLESESEAYEAAEAARRVKRPSPAPSFRPRPAPSTPMYVTQTQLQASLARVDGKIKTVSEGVSTINSRITALSTSFKKESEERKKSLENQSKDLNQKLQLLALLPILVQAPSKTLNAATPLQDTGGNNIPAVSVPDTNNLDALLPVLLVSGLGGTGGLGLGGDSSSAGTDNSLMLLALVLAFANKSS